MGNQMRTRNILLATSLAFVATTALSSCGSEDEPASQSSSSSTPSQATSSSSSATPASCMDPSVADRSDPSALGADYLSIAWCWNPAEDDSPTSTTLRAKPLMSPEWADQQVKPQRNSMQADWNEARTHHRVAVPTVAPARGDASDDVGDDKAIRAYKVDWTWQGADATQHPGGTANVTVYMEKHGQDWTVVGAQTTTMDQDG